MKNCSRPWIFTLLLLFSILVSAQETPQAAIGVTSKRTTLKSFLDAEGKQKGPAIEVASVIFPLRIYERSSAGYVRARVGDVPVWLDPDQLVLEAKVEVKCLVSSKSSATVAGGLRGANEGCK